MTIRYGAVILGVALMLIVTGVVEAERSRKSHGGPVRDYVSLVDALRAKGATVDPAGAVTVPVFSSGGQMMTVNGQNAQVYEFSDQETARAAAKTVSPDGSTVGSTSYLWVATPHFYREGKLIVLYIGDEKDLLRLFKKILGRPFAGGHS